MNGFSNDWFGSGGFRTAGATRDEPPAPMTAPAGSSLEGSFTPWSHGTETRPALEAPMPRLQNPVFGPAHSFALMSGRNPGFLGAVRVLS